MVTELDRRSHIWHLWSAFFERYFIVCFQFFSNIFLFSIAKGKSFSQIYDFYQGFVSILGLIQRLSIKSNQCSIWELRIVTFDCQVKIYSNMWMNGEHNGQGSINHSYYYQKVMSNAWDVKYWNAKDNVHSSRGSNMITEIFSTKKWKLIRFLEHKRIHFFFLNISNNLYPIFFIFCCIIYGIRRLI